MWCACCPEALTTTNRELRHPQPGSAVQGTCTQTHCGVQYHTLGLARCAAACQQLLDHSAVYSNLLKGGRCVMVALVSCNCADCIRDCDGMARLRNLPLVLLTTNPRHRNRIRFPGSHSNRHIGRVARIRHSGKVTPARTACQSCRLHAADCSALSITARTTAGCTHAHTALCVCAKADRK